MNEDHREHEYISDDEEVEKGDEECPLIMLSAEGKKKTDQGALETNFNNQSHGEEDWLYISNGKTPSTVENPGRFRSGRLGG